MARRIADWQDVTRRVAHREPLEGGVRLVFGVEPPLSEIARLAAAEYACCPFFGFAITVDSRGTALEVTAPSDGVELVAAAFGVAG